jgi:hypothetical protein
LGGLLASALAVELGPSAERTQAAKSPKQCRQINNRRKRWICLRRAKRRARRRNNQLGRGLLRNFALTVVNNSSRSWDFVVGGDVVRNRVETVRRNTTRRLLIEDDVAYFFVPNGTTGPAWVQHGALVFFNNLNIGDVLTKLLDPATYNSGHNELDGNLVTGSGKAMKVDDSRAVNFGFVSFVVTRNADDKNSGDYYKEFTLTFS